MVVKNRGTGAVWTPASAPVLPYITHRQQMTALESEALFVILMDLEAMISQVKKSPKIHQALEKQIFIRWEWCT